MRIATAALALALSLLTACTPAPAQGPPAPDTTGVAAMDATPVTTLRLFDGGEADSVAVHLFFADAAAARKAVSAARCISGVQIAPDGGVQTEDGCWQLALHYPEHNDSDVQPYVLAPLATVKSEAVERLPAAHKARVDGILASSGHLILRALPDARYEIIGYSESPAGLLRIFTPESGLRHRP